MGPLRAVRAPLGHAVCRRPRHDHIDAHLREQFDGQFTALALRKGLHHHESRLRGGLGLDGGDVDVEGLTVHDRSNGSRRPPPGAVDEGNGLPGRQTSHRDSVATLRTSHAHDTADRSGCEVGLGHDEHRCGHFAVNASLSREKSPPAGSAEDVPT